MKIFLSLLLIFFSQGIFASEFSNLSVMYKDVQSCIQSKDLNKDTGCLVRFLEKVPVMQFNKFMRAEIKKQIEQDFEAVDQTGFSLEEVIIAQNVTKYVIFHSNYEVGIEDLFGSYDFYRQISQLMKKIKIPHNLYFSKFPKKFESSQDWDQEDYFGFVLFKESIFQFMGIEDLNSSENLFLSKYVRNLLESKEDIKLAKKLMRNLRRKNEVYDRLKLFYLTTPACSKMRSFLFEICLKRLKKDIETHEDLGFELKSLIQEFLVTENS